MRRICVTGPECTGKTTLARRLAEELEAPWVPEAARSYAEQVGRVLTMEDVEPIAREHIAAADAAAATGASVVVLDQDLVSTSVYGRYYYGFSSPWLVGEAAARQADLYLLCNVDVPWTPDGIRDRPDDRDEMFRLFREELARRNANTVVIRGDWDARWRTALAAAQHSRRAG
jgi:HTH-type transcriptional regulator, transcriptional repressor of NAD biosynthesis genes